MQTAVKSVIEPIFEADFCEHSYGFRPQRDARMSWACLLKCVFDIDIETLPALWRSLEDHRRLVDPDVIVKILAHHTLPQIRAEVCGNELTCGLQTVTPL